MPVITSSCASSDSQDTTPFTGGTGGKDATNDKGGGGTTGSGATGGMGATGGGGMGATGGTTGGGGGGTGGTSGGGTGGGGTCNPATCPTPAPPAQKCCVTANGPCGIDYGQGAGCQVPPTGDI